MTARLPKQGSVILA